MVFKNALFKRNFALGKISAAPLWAFIFFTTISNTSQIFLEI